MFTSSLNAPYLLILALSLAMQFSVVAAEDLRRVRVVYLVSADRTEVKEYTAAIDHAIRDLQQWYGKQLNGVTFRLRDPVVEVVQSGKPATWFSSHTNGSRQDDWGYNNTLAEARQLVGAKHFDPKFVWVLYSDGPGNKGRGGSGVTCLPEDDLLGLVGKHPRQKDKSRWIAGLGHELGHAFGLPHPKDTAKYADALMWTGIYGKYPDKTYLTEEDKQRLLKSPFFYRSDGTPVVREPKVVARYAYKGGAFVQHDGTPIEWAETTNDGAVAFRFKEVRRDKEHIYIRDAGRSLIVRLPVQGGWASISSDNESTWHHLHELSEPAFP